MKRSGLRIVPFVFVLFLSVASVAHGNIPDEISSCYHPMIGGLIEQLSADGFDLEFLSKLFLDPRAELMPELMTLSLVSKETTDFYANFLLPESINLAKTFLRSNSKILNQAEKKFHVDKEVIVAILLVESRFGQNIGKRRAIPTLASIAVMDSEENFRNSLQVLTGLDPDLGCEWIEATVRRRAQWAYHELKSLLNILRNEKMDPLEVKSSYAGAVGMPQFLPSSYLTYAMNSKSFEEWLFSKEEAVVSIANYLKSNGWKKNLSVQRKRQVLWSYNHSEPYIDTLLKIAERIKPEISRPRRRRPSKK